MKFNELLRHLAQYHGEMREEEWRLLTEKMSQLKFTKNINDTFFSLNTKLKTIDLETCDNKMFIYLAELYSIINEQELVNIKFFTRVC
jgi:NADH:ubiquinone oxidoreductase subunit C